MSKKYAILPLLLLAIGCTQKESSTDRVTHRSEPVVASDTIPEKEEAPQTENKSGKEALLKAYPDFIVAITDNKVKLADGSSIVYDDGRKKGFKELLDDTDVEDMFYKPYHVPSAAPEYLEDVGRMRNEQLFKKMYGSSSKAVQCNLVSVQWFGGNVLFNSRNGAADSLRAVAAELKKHPELRKYLNSSGTFNWRPVRGAKRMSAHSYGIAFDIGVDHSDYWQWNAGTNDEMKHIKYANKIPKEIVRIFERHGFIWGGSWYHYDTMHFEFRPEILWYARFSANTK